MSHEHHDHSDHEADLTATAARVTSRHEQKARKALDKSGLVKVEGISRVVLKKPRGILVVVENPEVYKGAGDAYIVFGEQKTEDISQGPQFMPQPQAGPGAAAAAGAGAGEADDEELASTLKGTKIEASDYEPSEEDVNTVLSQVEGKDKEEVTAALKETGGDLLSAIQKLS